MHDFLKGLSVECPYFRAVVLILQWGRGQRLGTAGTEILKSFGLHAQQSEAKFRPRIQYKALVSTEPNQDISTLNSEFHHFISVNGQSYFEMG